ncbi:MAG: hypothetical protein C1941_06030 [Prosthecochloris sp.]|nr:hypothetical protein [Prosthecochloris sp.]
MQLHHPSCTLSPFGNVPVTKFIISCSLVLFLSSCAEREDPLEGSWKIPGKEVILEFRNDGSVSRSIASKTTTRTYRRDAEGNLFLDLGKGERLAELSGSGKELTLNGNGNTRLLFLRKQTAARVDSAQAIFNMGFDIRDCDSSISLYSTVISLLKAIPSEKGHLARAYNNRGICEEKNGNLEAAIADYDKAIALDPDLDIAYGNRAWLYESIGMKDKAASDYRKAAELGYRPAIYWIEQQKELEDEKPGLEE